MKVDLTGAKITSTLLDSAFIKQYIGGAASGPKFLDDQAPLDVKWPDPLIRLFIGPGPLGRMRTGDSGSITAITKGSLIDGLTVRSTVFSGRASGMLFSGPTCY